MKILLLSRYESMGASSRVRYLQYLDYFRSNGIQVQVAPLLSNDYLQALYSGRPRLAEILAGYSRRLRTLLHSRRYDLLVIEKELFPFLPPAMEQLLSRLGVPYLVDFDDAVFHRYDLHESPFIRRLLGRKIDVVMQHASVVVTGNEYLADRARRAGAKRVEVIPTVVDLTRYTVPEIPTNRVPVVGWIGTPVTSRYLFPLIPVFEWLKKRTAVRFIAIGARTEDFEGTPVEVWPWAEETEIRYIKSMDIGIMVLPDTPWERGKCGYKLIQYMACGLPVVASPVGVNREIVRQGENGFLAQTIDEWRESLEALLSKDPMKRRAMGMKGRLLVERRYSLQAQAPRFLEMLRVAVQ